MTCVVTFYDDCDAMLCYLIYKYMIIYVVLFILLSPTCTVSHAIDHPRCKAAEEGDGHGVIEDGFSKYLGEPLDAMGRHGMRAALIELPNQWIAQLNHHAYL